MEAHRLKQMKAILEATNGLNHNFMNNQLAEYVEYFHGRKFAI